MDTCITTAEQARVDRVRKTREFVEKLTESVAIINSLNDRSKKILKRSKKRSKKV